MKKTAALDKIKDAEAIYAPRLDAYTNTVLFPKKLTLVTDLLEKHIVPNKKKRIRKVVTSPALTDLQKELLDVYILEPSEQQLCLK